VSEFNTHMLLQANILISHLEAFGMLFSMYWYIVTQFCASALVDM